VQTIRIELTLEQLKSLVTMTENQFFRLKFIDPKQPGHKARPNELEIAKSVTEVLQVALKKETGFSRHIVSKT
jgi:hypothetical protein